MNRRSTVWIGDLDKDTDEDFLVQTFTILGERLCSVKIIRKSSDSMCYGFLEFPDEDSAQRVLHKYNGKPFPNSSSKRFKLNHTNYSKDGTGIVKEYSLFVGDLGPEVDDLALFDAFANRYKTVKLAKVIYDNFGVSKGYGFVHFCNKSEYEAALIEMQNTHIGSKAVRVSTAQQKSSSSSSSRTSSSTTSVPGQDEQAWQQQYPGYDYSSYYAAWQNYQQQSAYYNYDQRYAAYGAYQYPQQYYADPTQAAAAGSTTPTAVTQQPAAQPAQTAYEVPENTIEEHDVPLDIDQINQDLMQRNESVIEKFQKKYPYAKTPVKFNNYEELYTALDNSRWLPVDNLDPPLIRIK